MNMTYRAYRVPYEWVPQVEKPVETPIKPLDVTTFRVPGAAAFGDRAKEVSVEGCEPYGGSNALCVLPWKTTSNNSVPGGSSSRGTARTGAVLQSGTRKAALALRGRTPGPAPFFNPLQGGRRRNHHRRIAAMTPRSSRGISCCSTPRI